MLEGLLFFAGICAVFALIPLLISFAAVKATEAQNSPRKRVNARDRGIELPATVGRLIGLAAFVGLCASLVVHISALMGIDVSQPYPSIWLLHFGIFAVAIPFQQSLKRQLGPTHRLSDYFTILPIWATVIEITFALYMPINFALFLIATQGGHPAFYDGKYVLEHHGRLIRELTQSEYHAFCANELRGFSGHWMAFYFGPFVYFLFRKKPNITLQGTPASGRP
jgi:hypothetical protein